MNASKENARLVLQGLLNLPDTIIGKDEMIRIMEAIVRKLPSEAAYAKDKKRKKAK